MSPISVTHHYPSGLGITCLYHVVPSGVITHSPVEHGVYIVYPGPSFEPENVRSEERLWENSDSHLAAIAEKGEVVGLRRANNVR